MTGEKTLICQLYGPMQSWGTSSRFEVRATDKYPSKSGIGGFVGAAKGISKDPVFFAKFNALKFGVRIDWPGEELMSDYQIVAGDPYASIIVKKKSGKYAKEYVSFYKKLPSKQRGPIHVRNGLQTHREYLVNAFFTIGLQGDEDFLLEIAEAIKNPCWFLYLGRKSCPLGMPVVPTMVEADLTTALTNYPTYEHPRLPFESELMRMVIDDPAGTEIKNDVRIGGEVNDKKKYAPRFVKHLSCPIPEKRVFPCI